MLLQRRSLRSRLDLLRSVSARELCVSRAQHSQQQHAGGVLRDLAPGEPVWARSFRQPDKWLKGTVANNQGTNRYVVNSGDGRLIPRHIDQIRRRSRMSDVPCPSGTNSDQFEGQVSIGSEDALADSNIPDVGSNDDVAEAISVTKSNSEISVPKPVEDPSEPTCTPWASAETGPADTVTRNANDELAASAVRYHNGALGSKAVVKTKTGESEPRGFCFNNKAKPDIKQGSGRDNEVVINALSRSRLRARTLAAARALPLASGPTCKVRPFVYRGKKCFTTILKLELALTPYKGFRTISDESHLTNDLRTELISVVLGGTYVPQRRSSG
ncbi:hypothetical protein ACJJTC_007131 [Scirpophaga incertulas]